ncbi:sensory transduction histidine kinase [Erythrobacter sp. NAP1]|uniref:sensor histidine kinase n=1 Tax=Erythrobacter sp. NAP1 TaxID=237727 RepID=UPI000068786A|nr:PAS domain-containing protein [Erythrobacter sp. NAP1]EAQ28042.1 sensory transduction histidine kinase [Erythrobacter sp. NAP1]
MTTALSSKVVEAAVMLLNESPSSMVLFTPDLTMLYINAAHEQMTGRSADEVVGRGMFEVFAPNPEKPDEASAKGAIEDGVAKMVRTREPFVITEQQHDLPDEHGVYEPRFWSLVMWPVVDGDEVVAIIQRSEDVTERVRQRRLTDAVRIAAEEASGLSFFSYDPRNDRFVRNSAIDEMFGFEPDEAGPTATPFFDRIMPDDLPAVQAEVERAMAGGAGTSAAFDYRVIIPETPGHRFIRVRAGIERDPVDGKLKLFGAFIDMTDVEEARARMEDLSQRNAALVIESNHRIKNSLAIAAAMLSYQIGATKSDEAQEALKASANRIMAISDVHGELHADTGVEYVDAGDLLKRFANSFARTIEGDENGCKISVTTQSIALPSRFAVSLALTLNELLTNAVKYGMSHDQDCEITVSLAQEGETVHLRVENPIAEVRFTKIVSEGVGSDLIHAFAQQLGGEIVSHEDDMIFKVRCSFPVPSDHES